MRRRVRVGWLLVGDERVASARIQGLSIHRELLRRGVRSEILSAPRRFDTRLRWKPARRVFEAIWRRRDVIVFQKVESSRAVRFARLARRVGTRVVFLQADVRDSPLYRVADCVVVSSAELARQLQPLCSAPITVIEDGIDLPRQVAARPSSRTKKLKLLWVGGRLNYPSLEAIRPVLAGPEFADCELVTVSDHPEAGIPWSRESAAREIESADAALIPCLETAAAKAKSNNRLTLFMAAGLPVVASPIPAYRAIVEQGETGFLASSPDEWAAAIRALRNPDLRRRMGAGARKHAWERFAPEVIAGQWEFLLRELLDRLPGAVIEDRRGIVQQER